ncbi:MAG: hypothetical protein AB8H79_07335 [Myxococcota bacterium]
MRMYWVLLASCASALPGDGKAVPEVPVQPEVEAAPGRTYAQIRSDLEARRVEIAERYKTATDAGSRARVLEEARDEANRALRDDLFPAWAGTTWDFYGTTQTPNDGEIACGHYVSVVLDHAGFDVQRLKLGRQASENIIKTFSKPKDIRRFSGKSSEEVVASVRQMGAGTFVLGLDVHAAFLISDGQTVQMCHSSYLGTAKVLCEDAQTSPAMESNYRVVGKLFDDSMMRKWLQGASFQTVGSG